MSGIYTATVVWKRPEGAAFTDNRYPRLHEWQFDGGVTVRASSSPQVVKVPLSAEDAVDPEEALVASLSACHMLFFLSFAARGGFVVDEYRDTPEGVMGKNADGRTAMTRIVLRPALRFAGGPPSVDQLADLHRRAHAECYIANSVKAEVVVEPS